MKRFGIVLLTLSLFAGWAHSNKQQTCSFPADGKNLARDGEASQSSLYQSKLYPIASLAIDGKTDTVFAKGTCTHTKNDRGPWWQVKLDKVYSVDGVKIHNRQDCCKHRLKEAEVRVGNSPNNDNPVCGTVTDISKPIISFCCKGAIGQYVSLVIPGRAEFLTLCEVEVYGKEVVAEEDVCELEETQEVVEVQDVKYQEEKTQVSYVEDEEYAVEYEEYEDEIELKQYTADS